MNFQALAKKPEQDKWSDYAPTSADFGMKFDKKFMVQKLGRKEKMKAKQIVAVLPGGELGQDGLVTWKATADVRWKVSCQGERMESDSLSLVCARPDFEAAKTTKVLTAELTEKATSVAQVPCTGFERNYL